MAVKETNIPIGFGTLRIKRVKHLRGFERWGTLPSVTLADRCLLWVPRNYDPGQPDICMIHIGKTGGTALKAVLYAHNAKRIAKPIELYRHEMTLPRLSQELPQTKTFFFVRDPVARFVSGFNSRLRRDPRKKKINWNPEEKFAFSKFTTPNELAEALSDPKREDNARRAMRSIQHVRESLSYYLGSVELLEQEREKILFIGRQETFKEDVERLKTVLGIDLENRPPTDIVNANRVPPTMSTELSQRAVENIQAWYKDDYPLLDWCLEYRNKMI